MLPAVEIHFAFVGKAGRAEVMCLKHMAAAGPRLDKTEVPVSAAGKSLGHFAEHLLWYQWNTT